MTTAGILAPVGSEMSIRVPSSEDATGTQAMPIARPSRFEKRELVIRPAGSPSAPITCEPSTGVLPLSQTKPTSSLRFPRRFRYSSW